MQVQERVRCRAHRRKRIRCRCKCKCREAQSSVVRRLSSFVFLRDQALISLWPLLHSWHLLVGVGGVAISELRQAFGRRPGLVLAFWFASLRLAGSLRLRCLPLLCSPRTLTNESQSGWSAAFRSAEHDADGEQHSQSPASAPKTQMLRASGAERGLRRGDVRCGTSRIKTTV